MYETVPSLIPRFQESQEAETLRLFALWSAVVCSTEFSKHNETIESVLLDMQP